MYLLQGLVTLLEGFEHLKLLRFPLNRLDLPITSNNRGELRVCNSAMLANIEQAPYHLLDVQEL
jgi:hypothetical protein